jgi:methylenetetrahydrofolate dehydrogenase (NADP+) / methenyltetrahydrofolate cyclohydrolase
MPARLLDGAAVARAIREELKADVQRLGAAGVRPGLGVLLVGEDPASAVYVRSKTRACEELGLHHETVHLPAAATTAEVLEVVQRYNASPAVHGILVQLPLPKQINEEAVIRAIAPAKDVDCFHPENVGLVAAGHPRFLPCTPAGCVQLLTRNGIPTAGKHVVVIGRSNIVGKPLALMLMQKPSTAFPTAGDATVTVVHRGTRDLPSIARQADILIAAVGVARFVTPEMVRPGAAVIDVGINTVDGKLVGDVREDVAEIAGHLSPVPGGVGPMTITMLLQNALNSAKMAC